MHEGEDAYYVTDTALADLVAAMSQTSPPLLRGDGALADTGRAVLAGQARPGRRLWHRSVAWRHTLTQRQRVAVG